MARKPDDYPEFGRSLFLLGVAAVAAAALTFWLALRAFGPAEDVPRPTSVKPAAMPEDPPGDSGTAPSSSVSPSASGEPAPTRTRVPPAFMPSATGKARPSVTPSTSSTTTVPAAPALTAYLRVLSSTDQGYVAGIRVVNNGRAAASWTITVRHAGQANLTLIGTRDATGRQRGTEFVFTGGPVPAGTFQEFGWQAGKTGSGGGKPAGCAIAGGTCGFG